MTIRRFGALAFALLAACGTGGAYDSGSSDDVVAPVVVSWVRPDPRLPDSEDTPDGRFGVRSFLPDAITRVEVWEGGELVAVSPAFVPSGGLWLAPDSWVIPVGQVAVRVYGGSLTYARGFVYDPFDDSCAVVFLLRDREWGF